MPSDQAAQPSNSEPEKNVPPEALLNDDVVLIPRGNPYDFTAAMVVEEIVKPKGRLDSLPEFKDQKIEMLAVQLQKAKENYYDALADATKSEGIIHELTDLANEYLDGMVQPDHFAMMALQILGIREDPNAL